MWNPTNWDSVGPQPDPSDGFWAREGKTFVRTMLWFAPYFIVLAIVGVVIKVIT